MDQKETYIGNNLEESKRFLELLMQNQDRLYAYILYRVPNRNDAEDILQDVIALMLAKFQDYEEGTNFLWWAITIAKYKTLSFHKRNKRMVLLFDEADMDFIQDEAVKSAESLDDEANLLKECLKKMSATQKKYISLRYEEDMTYRKIASYFHVSVQSAYRMVARIQVSLLKCIRLSLQSETTHE